MPRCALRRRVHVPRVVLQAVCVCLLTFGLVLPALCHRLLYSYYFLRSRYLDTVSEQALAESFRRGQEALRYWTSPDSDPRPTDTGPGEQTSRPHLLVTVVTTRRAEGGEYHYLLQVMQRPALLLSACQGPSCPAVLVCDVESSPQRNEDAALVEKKFSVVRMGGGETGWGRDLVNTFEKEKQDYVFCLRKGWELMRPRNVVVLEDDALPRGDFLPVVEHLLLRTFSRGSLYVKLNHPERLQRYWNPEPWRILEWVGLGAVGGSALLQLLRRFGPAPFPAPPLLLLLLLMLYIMATAELIGRHYLLEFRRLSPQLYAVAPATECCTPAMLFAGNASLRVASYLEAEFCSQGRAKDTMLYRIARSTPGERAHSLEPNLITHIEAFSSVRANPSRPRLL